MYYRDVVAKKKTLVNNLTGWSGSSNFCVYKKFKNKLYRKECPHERMFTFELIKMDWMLMIIV
jgi:hypothetical protein